MVTREEALGLDVVCGGCRYTCGTEFRPIPNGFYFVPLTTPRGISFRHFRSG